MTAPGIGRASRVMAAGTVVSRATGFGRAAVLAAALGTADLADAYNVANVLPNVVYELLLGGVLTGIVVPLLVRAAKEDGDDGEAFAQRLLTLVLVVLGAVSLLAVLAAPLLVGLYGLSGRTGEVSTLLARLVLPEILFYGLGAVVGAVLQTRGRYAPPMWAPVLNNVVVIATAGVFLALPGPDRLDVGSVTTTQVVVLGVGTTLGIVAQTLALLPSLRATGFRWRLRRDLRGSGLGQVGRLGAWVLLYVAVAQAGYLVVTRLATGAGQEAPGYGFTPYVLAFTLFQLPHAVVAVSVITALLPRMSRAAADGRLDEVRADVGRGVRLVALVLVPCVAGYLLLGRDVAVAVLGHGATGVEGARVVGAVLTAFAVGLLPFSAYQLQQRAFYALGDTRTPALISVSTTAVLVVVDVGLALLLPVRQVVVGLAAGYAVAYTCGLVVSCVVLRRRLAGLDLPATSRYVARLVAAAGGAAVPAGLAAAGLDRLLDGPLGEGPLTSLLVLAGSGTVLLVGYAVLAAALRVPEVTALRRQGLRALR